MTEDDVTLYNNLMRLCDKDESSFYYVDQLIDNVKYRIYLYRLATWTEFQQPDALWARGTMFELNKHSKPVRLACRPFKKFFNLGEGCDASSHDFSDDNIEVIMDKLDGSLISSYIHYPDLAYYPDAEPQLRLKTKGSLHSEQAVAATKWLHQPENARLLHYIKSDTLIGYTVNMEWIGIENRVVLPYEKTELKVLGIIDKYGDTVSYDIMRSGYGSSWVVANFTEQATAMGVANYIQSVNAMTGIEGVVIRLKSGLMLKVKTTAYVTLHKTKDSISAPRNLYEAIVNETGDDLRVMFLQDRQALALIDAMQVRVTAFYNSLVKTVEEFYQTNARLLPLSRKDYAIKGQNELNKMQFSLAMVKYTGGTPDYKQSMLKHWDDFKAIYDMTDEPTVTQDE